MELESIISEIKEKGYDEPLVHDVDPNIRTGAKYAAISVIDAQMKRTDGQIYTLFYMMGLLDTQPDMVTKLINEEIIAKGGNGINDCTIEQASEAIMSIAKRVQNNKNIQVIGGSRD